MRIVRVKWIDAFSPDMIWIEPEVLKEKDPHEVGDVISVGYLIEQTDLGVWLAMCASITGKVGQTFFIPTNMIIELEELE